MDKRSGFYRYTPVTGINPRINNQVGCSWVVPYQLRLSNDFRLFRHVTDIDMQAKVARAHLQMVYPLNSLNMMNSQLRNVD